MTIWRLMKVSSQIFPGSNTLPAQRGLMKETTGSGTKCCLQTLQQQSAARADNGHWREKNNHKVSTIAGSISFLNGILLR
jgi:hypothetical protein